jgi:large subunit ribosomal protein L30e
MEEDEKVEEATGESEESLESAKQEEELSGEGAEETAEEAPKEKKKKKVVRRRKTKKERENPLTTAVRLAVESGKVEFGARAALVAGQGGKAMLFVAANNAPSESMEKVEKLAKASGVPIIVYDGSSMELGSVCGRPFPVSVLSVFEAGSSNIMELAKKK